VGGEYFIFFVKWEEEGDVREEWKIIVAKNLVR